MNDKIYQKHLFFIKKNLNWDAMPEHRKYAVVRDYVMNVNHPSNKRQELARKIYHAGQRELTHDGLLKLAIGVTVS